MLATTMERHDGRAVRVARLGSGRPLVLLHGYPDNLQIFSALAPLLSHAHAVVAFDWPGMGESERWQGGASPFDQAERLRVLLQAWGHPDVSLVAMDMGAPAALALAARDPARVRRLVVLNSLVMPEAPTSWEIRVLRRRAVRDRLLRSWPRLVFRRAVSSSLPAGAVLPRDLHDDLWRSFQRAEVRRFVAQLCADHESALPTLARSYPHVRCPTLVLWGARDRHFPIAHAEGLRAAIAGARATALAGGEHWMAWHRASDVASAVLEELEDGAPSRP